MVKVDLKGVVRVKSKGRTYWYAWRGGPRLKGEPGSQAFMASYNQAIEDHRAPDASQFCSLVVLYKASGDFKKLADSTKRNWSRWLDRIADYFGNLIIAQFDRPEKIRPVIREWRNQWTDKPRTAVNTIMQTCFFAISNVLPREEAIAQIKKSIRKTYSRKGDAVVQQNFAAVKQTLAALHEVKIPPDGQFQAASAADCSGGSARFCPAGHRPHAGQQGRFAPRQRLPGGRDLADRNNALGKARHRAGNPGMGLGHLHPMQQVRAGLPARRHPREVLRPQQLAGAPAYFKSTPFRSQEWKDTVIPCKSSPEDCTGCNLCVAVCPVKSKTDPKHKAINMMPMPPLRAQEKANYEFFLEPALARPDQAGAGRQRQSIPGAAL